MDQYNKYNLLIKGYWYKNKILDNYDAIKILDQKNKKL